LSKSDRHSYIHRFHLYFVFARIHHRSEPSSNTNPPPTIGNRLAFANGVDPDTHGKRDPTEDGKSWRVIITIKKIKKFFMLI